MALSGVACNVWSHFWASVSPIQYWRWSWSGIVSHRGQDANIYFTPLRGGGEKSGSVGGENVGTMVFIKLIFTALHSACFQNTIVPGPLGKRLCPSYLLSPGSVLASHCIPCSESNLSHTHLSLSPWMKAGGQIVLLRDLGITRLYSWFLPISQCKCL